MHIEKDPGTDPPVVAHEAETILEENRKLRESVNTITIDLLEKTRLLEIEAALERVRTVAMAMKQPGDMLDVCRTISDQLVLLQLGELRNVQTIIIYESKGIYMNYEYYTRHHKQLVTEVDYFLHPAQVELVHEMQKGPEGFFTKSFSGEELQKWFEYQKTTPQFLDSYLATASSINWYFYSVGPIGLGISTYAPLDNEEVLLFKRFRNVFELAYRRYLDIEKAEAQAREAQIEAAVERVRAKSLAMHKSEEIMDVVARLRNELISLNIPGVTAATIYLEQGEDGQIRLWDLTALAGTEDGFLFTMDRVIKLKETDPELWFQKIWNSKEKYFIVEQDQEDLKRTVEWVRQYDPEGADSIQREIEENNIEHGWHPTVQLEKGRLSVDLIQPPPAEIESILQKMGAAFDLAYRRFEDLKNAEAQARESEIQLALERVRARTMAMQKSDELPEAASLLFQQVQSLAIPAWSAGYCIWDEDKQAITLWMSSEDVLQPPARAPLTQDPSFIRMREAYERGETFFVEEIGGGELIKHYQYMRTLPVVGEILDSIIEAGHPLPTFQIFHLAYFSQGFLLFITYEPVPEAHDIFKRFGKVFDQTYTRFLDLQKAEALARDAQIEAALERVRAKVMAMNSSKDLNDASLVFGELLRALGIDWQFSYFWLIEEDKDENTFWITWPDKKTSTTTYSLAEADESFRECIVAWQRQDKIHSTYVAVQDVQAWLDTFERITVDAGGEAVKVMRADNFKNGVYYYDAMIKFGSFGILINRPISEEEKNIQSRFAVEFERAYTRFLELQKAESQTREAQIETALERVRSRTMGMHKSEDLKEVIQVVYDQFVHLHIHVEHAGFIMDYKARNDMHIWLADKHAVPFQVNIPYFDCAHWNSFNDAKATGREFFANHLSFEEKNRFYRDLFKLIPVVPEETLEYYFNCPGLAISTVLLENVGLYIENFSGLPYSEEENKILMRFGKVFQQTYTRFLDLQKAEAQAREAQIEAAVERVRAKALAMHKSEDLHGVVVALKHQLNGLKIENVTAVSMYLEQDDGRIRGLDLSGVSDVDGGNEAFKMDVVFRLEDTDPDLWIRRIWNTNEDYFVLEADEDDFERIIKWLYTLDAAEAAVAEKVIKENGIRKAWLPTVKLQKGKLNIDLLQPPTPEVQSILLKMGAAFDLAYKRYLDLQNAEAQTREAQIEASLERVRGKAMSMHSSQDLADTIGVFYRELHSFSITPRRCGVGLINKETRVCELFTWNTTDKGESLELVGKIKMEGHPVLENVYNNWLTQTEYHPVLRGTEITEYYKLLRPQMSFPDYGKDEVQFGYFFFFKEGGVYAWTNNEMKEDELNIYRRFNSVLSLTYKRYKDLQLAEAHAIQAEKDLLEIKAARMKAEEALAELKNTQQQLIQSEKMASLGELTAGIAHEIQNPLNFVNNFSELNLELLSEVKEELRQGNVPDALAITEDIERNLEKVAHHGKRADAIVKGMLQHSRKTTSEKESIDINALVDEYIRLSYHGLRAKDKSFNTIIETHFDPSVGKVDIVGQDIGRVLLNLLNNAFYAVNEKKKVINDWYEPLVQVSTNRSNNTIEIKVKDNGVGIPEKVMDKIYQPFFTTKPTGEGTGLGLSLSYDIITKGHGGEMKVVTKEGEFTEFNINLPVM